MSTICKLDPMVRLNRKDRSDTRKQIREAGAMPCHANERIERIVADPRFPGVWKQSQHDQLLYDLDEYTREQKHKARLLAELAAKTEPDANCVTTPDGGCVGGPCMHDPEPVDEGYDANGSPVE
jgi:hypothetical protein